VGKRGARLCFTVHEALGTPPRLGLFHGDLVDFGPFLDGEDYHSPALIKDLFTFRYQGEKEYCFNVAKGLNQALENPKPWSLNGSSQWFQVRIKAARLTKNGRIDGLRMGFVEKGDVTCLRDIAEAILSVSNIFFKGGRSSSNRRFTFRFYK